MKYSNKDINRIRAELGALVPERVDEPLPPQPSILPPALPLSTRRYKMKKVAKGLLHPELGAKYIQEYRQNRFKSQPANMVKAFSFDKPKRPMVSIVIPVFNKFNLTYECLHSLRDNISDSIDYEVIVVDNNSADQSHLLAQMDGLVYIRNKDNLGFVDGCNVGAKKAKGKFIVFLNNDAVVEPNWLESLVESIQTIPNAGLVGSKIIYPDGRLQEAGGVIFKDGSGNNYGKNDHPDRYQYNYVRDVDYCSGASIIITRQLFESFGGFDQLYAPAYYEDTDLAFKVRKAGLRVIYQPESVIYHIEGATAGTSTSSGFKKYQAINHDKFLKRWSETLSSSHYDTEQLYEARDRNATKYALIMDENIPTPDQDSGSVRMLRMIESLLELGYKVTFFPNNTQKKPKYLRPLQQAGVEVVYGEVTGQQFLKEHGHIYDLVILSRPRIGSYYIDLCQGFCKKAKIIYDTVDLHYLRLHRQADFATTSEDKEYLLDMSKKHEVLEKFLMSETDQTLVVSQAEVEILKDAGCKNVTVVSNIHSIDSDSYKHGFDDRKNLLFVGGYAHHPNIDAIRWFVTDIFPLILKKDPRIQLHVVGSQMPDDLREFLENENNVIVDGFVENLGPLLRSTRVFIAPLRYGAGVKGKIGQAIEHGMPVVSTSIGAEGMFLQDGVSAMVGDTEEAFAKKVLALYGDKKQWTAVQKNARKVLAEHFSPEHATKALKSVIKTR